MAAALTLAARSRGRTAPNPNVGCVIVLNGRVVGRGWTQPGGRPHAEAMALAEAGDAARGATAYVTLEPCAHESARGPACASLLVAAGVARVVAALRDPDPRTDGDGFRRLRAAGIAVADGVGGDDARRSMAGFLTRRRLGRPFVTLKLATSLDGRIALPDGASRWITGPESRAHAHLERSRHEAILVGRRTWDADRPALDVRLPGLAARSPLRVVLSSTRSDVIPADAGTHGSGMAGGESTPPSVGPSVRRDDEGLADDGLGSVVVIPSPHAIASLPGDHILVEGGAGTAAAFLAADLVDRLLLYRAPVIVGAGLAAIGDIGLTDLAAAHGRWRCIDARPLGSDRLEVYERILCSPA
ncbi:MULTISPECIES: bifunctional diaminohydroxyphosphoribosylaminopyrimidine deaminase/5-amino-6-(5-phosphoribosylamino)uracil reductase RibD [unclassified Sphingomonas]|jgi:diaminohydroxyphosphoribosylaminopyrimidine deaminase / 5-amino-6-(5-phosphoribosylamino)uracil reductase|uniref:bifunctional diaminohydroxyphosphoribosylaminopyrimidine deaminase/5-amino-6-(5-phosphoribosylamino)uracil reductase RibD n=1 Tax=unclassified Sphingomonas TaxID=196159 RepID=UPI000E10D8F5|nr:MULTISPECIES: bifunctional diaminohydroxyphosphoribosylaminopyrimidine deaminase/5-amino-6-(5-phosphoribosylamino)uracil reductase RibD [unclassified Sphingomonas]AXJ96884.1 bifunctional diaminohydroxyphosphoribosylaminopyrimidine deaminase/5-amino-6-(5-phosphoribosylamino)uracil reductase RibD [Sphingomonas sp. FARSPH]